ncbi:ATP-NAD kinase family protein [Nonomuraea sp. NPDC050790]|uniref:ATP-NAD kinase family protein n=1 Tax=Nonomuraea sp. NPDC050790 TaxID=3364371 RepID=UPI003795315E
MFTVGLVVNPVAGLGGSAGLKGSDGTDVQREALARGARPRAGERAAQAVRTLLARRPDTRIVTPPGPMGVEGAHELVHLPAPHPEADQPGVGQPGDGQTTAADTRAAVVALAHVDLLLFAGGDGTARDVLDALQELGDAAPPVLGIPAGVKVYSGCFALSPATAGFVAAEFDGRTAEAEVVDLDEELYRRGAVSPRLYGSLRVPAARAAMSGRKTGSSATSEGTVEGIAREVVATMRPGIRYVLGPGATTLAVGRELGLATTLLGVDVIERGGAGFGGVGGVVVGADVSESELFELVRGERAALVLSVIGGQGFVLGRGNQQVSPRVLDAVRDGGGELIVLATQQKLAGLNGRPLLADTGDEETDRKLSGHVRVITGHRESTIYRISPASADSARDGSSPAQSGREARSGPACEESACVGS